MTLTSASSATTHPSVWPSSKFSATLGLFPVNKWSLHFQCKEMPLRRIEVQFIQEILTFFPIYFIIYLCVERYSWCAMFILYTYNIYIYFQMYNIGIHNFKCCIPFIAIIKYRLYSLCVYPCSLSTRQPNFGDNFPKSQKLSWENPRAASK